MHNYIKHTELEEEKFYGFTTVKILVFPQITHKANVQLAATTNVYYE